VEKLEFWEASRLYKLSFYPDLPHYTVLEEFTEVFREIEEERP
jgi:hypothetical protein